MYDLITKYFEGQISPEEKRDLFSRIHTDEEWRKEFVAIQNLRGLTSWIPSEEGKAMAVGSLLAFKQSEKEKSRRSFYRQWMGYAAAILVSVFSTWAAFYFSTREEGLSTEDMAEVFYEEFTSPAGQRALLKLQDGTTVWLNARTTLRYPNRFSKSERTVELDGEAFFEVKENRDIPFIVNTETLSMKVTGTKFNVFAYRGNTEFSTSLTEGAVTVSDLRNKGNSIELKPNERAVLKGNRLRKEAFHDMSFLLWKDGIYAFDNVPFREMARKLELYYDVTIAVNNRELENYPFNGKFRQRDGIENVLKTLMKIRKFTWTKDDEKNVITIR
ncbi:MAG: FecR domain-containing protein [Tannerella sp.]|jgi:ferric-dicitrate binding protein FerR (iron transport regulator)|nr:FecR domain-containing protein [Tannerella sp.]